MIDNLIYEIWKDVPGFEGRYQASTMGRIKSIIGGEEKLLIPFKDRCSYERITMSVRSGEGSSKLKQKIFTVHRVIATTFLANPDPSVFTEINHKDGNKHNNCVENLEWTTRSENMLHAFKTGLVKNNTGPRKFLFCQYDKSGKLIHKWNSVNDCAFHFAQLGFGEIHILVSNINACLNDRSKTCCGYIFSYRDDVEPEENIERVQNAAKVAVLAYPLVGNKGAYHIEGEPIRFRGVNETEGYVMPNGKKAIATIVSKCCKGKRDSHAGYKWVYESEKDKDITLATKRIIDQIDPVTNEVIKEWDCGVVNIAKQLGYASSSSLSSCLSGELKTAYGYKWKYKC